MRGMHAMEVWSTSHRLASWLLQAWCAPLILVHPEDDVGQVVQLWCVPQLLQGLFADKGFTWLTLSTTCDLSCSL